MKTNENSFVILIPGFADSETDTTCLPMQQAFVRYLKEQYPGLRIIILAFQYPYEIKKYEWFGIEVMSFSGRNMGGLKRFFLRRKLISVLKKINGENKIAGLLSFWYGECAWIGKRFGDYYNIRHACWIMGQDARPGNRYPRKLSLAPEDLIALSDFLKDEFQKNHHVRPMHVIPAGIDPGEFQKTLSTKDIDILGAGSLIPLKQFDVLIEIVGNLREKLPNIRAMIVGEGPEKKLLQEKIAVLGLSANITLTGEVSHPEVLQFMQRSKVLLHPSNYEGFSGVCLEALYAGAQVISFTKPMKSDIDGWQIAGTVDEMIRMTAQILNAPDLRESNSSAYLMKDTVKKLVELYHLD